jgi:hypothetical protein
MDTSAVTQITSPPSTFNPDEQLLAWAMSLLWIRFIVNGNPNTPLNKSTESTWWFANVFNNESFFLYHFFEYRKRK